MYSTCIFCHAGLGSNEAIEHFPVGRRLAFDAAKGRLWVVCSACERWNLSPLEERWEAILVAAEKVLDQKGYQAATLRDVASRVGLQTGSLYYYIDSKEDLLFSVLRRAHPRPGWTGPTGRCWPR